MIDNPFVCDLPLADQIKNVHNALDNARRELASYRIAEDRAFRDLESPEYHRRTVAGDVWRNARPWLSAAWNVRQAQAQLRELYAAQREADRPTTEAAEAKAVEWALASELSQVVWSNVWNWTHTGGIASRVHLTNDEGLTGKTLCGKTFPRIKGTPTCYARCKACQKKAGITKEQWNALGYVPSAVD